MTHSNNIEEKKEMSHKIEKKKVICKTCGAEKSKFATCKNPEHSKIIDERLNKMFPKKAELYCANCQYFRLPPHNCSVVGSAMMWNNK